MRGRATGTVCSLFLKSGKQLHGAAGRAYAWLRGRSCLRLFSENPRTYVYATSSRNRTIQWPTLNSGQAAATICDQSNNKKGVSILFGREDRGLTNEELQLANTNIEIPANPEYPVLNLAMSAQILCYEIFKASNNTEARDWHDYPEVDSANLQMLIDHFIETAVNIDVIHPDNPKKIISRIKRMFSRLHPDEMEASFLRGFLAAINKKIK